MDCIDAFPDYWWVIIGFGTLIDLCSKSRSYIAVINWCSFNLAFTFISMTLIFPERYFPLLLWPWMFDGSMPIIWLDLLFGAGTDVTSRLSCHAGPPQHMLDTQHQGEVPLDLSMSVAVRLGLDNATTWVNCYTTFSDFCRSRKTCSFINSGIALRNTWVNCSTA